MRLLTHVCCGPCFTATHESLAAQGRAVTAYFVNPNIHPPSEMRRRRIYLERFCLDRGVPLVLAGNDMTDYFRAIHGVEEKPQRCRRCYRVRLEATARRAAARNFDAFTTTLLISPYQDHDQVAEIASAAGEAHGVPFFYQDFRPLFRRSIDLSRELSMYRQKYCGCLFSEEERPAKKRDRREP